MFLRRIPRSRRKKIREALWPSMGLKRLALYYKHRMGRLPGTPRTIALGFATGMAVSITPFVGLHIILGTLIAWMTGASIFAVIVGTLVGGNPWTFPVIWIGSYKLGSLMLGHVKSAANAEKHIPDSFSLSLLMHKPEKLLLPMTLGCIPMCIIAWFASYYIARDLVVRYRHARMERLKAKHEKAAAHDKTAGHK